MWNVRVVVRMRLKFESDSFRELFNATCTLLLISPVQKGDFKAFLQRPLW